MYMQERAINKAKGCGEEPKVTKQQLLFPQRKPRKSVTGYNGTRRKKEGLSKWQKELLEVCENEDEKKAVASIG